MYDILNTQDYNNIINKPGVTVVKFYGDACGPCRVLDTVMGPLISDFTDITFTKYNTIDLENIAAITSVPTLILFRDGQEVSRLHGLKTIEEIRTWLLS